MVLEVKGIDKSFPGTQALSKVDFQLRKGEILGVAGLWGLSAAGDRYRAGGLRCSVKALQVDDERAAVRDYRKAAATEGLGTFADLLRAKLDTPAK